MNYESLVYCWTEIVAAKQLACKIVLNVLINYGHKGNMELTTCGKHCAISLFSNIAQDWSDSALWLQLFYPKVQNPYPQILMLKIRWPQLQGYQKQNILPFLWAFLLSQTSSLGCSKALWAFHKRHTGWLERAVQAFHSSSLPSPTLSGLQSLELLRPAEHYWLRVDLPDLSVGQDSLPEAQ